MTQSADFLDPRQRRGTAADLLDPRQRRAAALVLGAVKLPAELEACGRQYLQAARIFPGCTAEDLMIGDPRGALRRARELIDQLLTDANPFTGDAS